MLCYAPPVLTAEREVTELLLSDSETRLENPIASDGLYMLLKVSEREYLEDFRSGNLYCNGPEFFRDGALRGRWCHDPNEGICGIYHPERTRFEISPAGGGKPFALEPTSPVKLWRSDHVRMFCLYAIYPDTEWRRQLSEEELPAFFEHMTMKQRILGAGERVAIVTDAAELVRRVRTACDKEGIRSSGGYAHYVDLAVAQGIFPEEVHGRVKDIRFSDEREWRFLFWRADGQLPSPFKLNAGPLSDIVLIKTWDEIKSGLTMGHPDDARQFSLIPA